MQLSVLARRVRRYLPAALAKCHFPSLDHSDNILQRLLDRPSSIESENSLSAASNKRADSHAIATASDFDFDGMQEVRLSNDHLCVWVPLVAAAESTNSTSVVLLTTCSQRCSVVRAYHRKVLAGPSAAGGAVASIHDRVVFKQADLDKQLGYDRFNRKSMMDHFFDDEVTMESLAMGRAQERGDFVELPYEAKIRRGGERIQLQMRRDGNAWGYPISITKAITMESSSSDLTITYLLENLPQDRSFHFAVEMNFAGLPSGADDRFFSDLQGNRLGQLGKRLDLRDTSGISLTDQWLGIETGLWIDRISNLWAMPVETVSQSEAGFELVHQSVCVMPHWQVRGDHAGTWSVRMKLSTRCRRNRDDIEVSAQHATLAYVG